MRQLNLPLSNSQFQGNRIPGRHQKNLKSRTFVPHRRNSSKTAILSKFEDWAKHAISEGLDEFRISAIRAEMCTLFSAFSNCASDNEKSDWLRKFLKHHDDIIITPIDKPKDIRVFEKIISKSSMKFLTTTKSPS